MTDQPNSKPKPLKLKHRFGFVPQYTTAFPTKLNRDEFQDLAIAAIKDLEWELAFLENHEIEAIRIGDNDRPSHIINMAHAPGKLMIKSTSLVGHFWDLGNNSMRVQLFMRALQERIRELDANPKSAGPDGNDQVVENNELPRQNLAEGRPGKLNLQIMLAVSAAIGVVLILVIAFASTQTISLAVFLALFILASMAIAL